MKVAPVSSRPSGDVYYDMHIIRETGEIKWLEDLDFT